MEEVIEVTIDTSQPPIIFDDELDQNMAEFFEMTNNITEEEISRYDNLMMVCTITPSTEVKNAVVLHWACDMKVNGYGTVMRSLLQNVKYSSNLQTLVDFENGATSHPKVMFALLNCIRKHMGCVMIVVDPKDITTGAARVFVVRRTEKKTAVM
jgi:hypothetical protein